MKTLTRLRALVAAALTASALTVALPSAPAGAAYSCGYDVEARGHVQNIGAVSGKKWGYGYCGNEVTRVGTVGRSLRLEQVTVQAFDNPDYRIFASAHIQYKGWVAATPAARYAVTAGTTGQGLRMEAFRLSMPSPNHKICYRAHVQNIGWMPWVTEGTMTGTTGRSLRIEALDFSIQTQGSNCPSNSVGR